MPQTPRHARLFELIRQNNLARQSLGLLDDGQAVDPRFALQFQVRAQRSLGLSAPDRALSAAMQGQG